MSVNVKVPPHCEEEPVATSTPAGSVSVKLMSVNVVDKLGLEIENVNVVDAPVRIECAPKFLAITGGAITVSVSVP